MIWAAPGSSPPAWGTLCLARTRTSVTRFIPTCVGNIHPADCKITARAVHPHLRGEHVCCFSRARSMIGSSPPAWGTCLASRLPQGQTLVHPHLRGEHIGVCPFGFRFGGSSPPAWGTFLANGTKHTHRRFIPTCVGNIAGSSQRDLRLSVHPHLRGEHCLSSCSTSSNAGSSPPAWGTLGGHYRLPVPRRFIPTCVGNIPSAPAGPRAPSVHPHLRGEHFKHKCSCRCFTGSSPPAWGTSDHLSLKLRDYRFIPTCVGNIRRDDSRYDSISVHPHLRGEHTRCR